MRFVDLAPALTRSRASEPAAARAGGSKSSSMVNQYYPTRFHGSVNPGAQGAPAPDGYKLPPGGGAAPVVNDHTVPRVVPASFFASTRQ